MGVSVQHHERSGSARRTAGGEVCGEEQKLS